MANREISRLLAADWSDNWSRAADPSPTLHSRRVAEAMIDRMRAQAEIIEFLGEAEEAQYGATPIELGPTGLVVRGLIDTIGRDYSISTERGDWLAAFGKRCARLRTQYVSQEAFGPHTGLTGLCKRDRERSLEPDSMGDLADRAGT